MDCLPSLADVLDAPSSRARMAFCHCSALESTQFTEPTTTGATVNAKFAPSDRYGAELARSDDSELLVPCLARRRQQVRCSSPPKTTPAQQSLARDLHERALAAPKSRGTREGGYPEFHGACRRPGTKIGSRTSRLRSCSKIACGAQISGTDKRVFSREVVTLWTDWPQLVESRCRLRAQACNHGSWVEFRLVFGVPA